MDENWTLDALASECLLNTKNSYCHRFFECGASCLAIILTTNKTHQDMIKQIWNLTENKSSSLQITGALSIGQIGKISDLSKDDRVL